jgi:hypothetical protein
MIVLPILLKFYKHNALPQRQITPTNVFKSKQNKHQARSLNMPNAKRASQLGLKSKLIDLLWLKLRHDPNTALYSLTPTALEEELFFHPEAMTVSKHPDPNSTTPRVQCACCVCVSSSPASEFIFTGHREISLVACFTIISV